MTKKKLINVNAGELFHNSLREERSTFGQIGFQFLGDGKIKLVSCCCNTIDGLIEFGYFDDFKIPEHMPINGKDYEITEIGRDTFIRTMVSIFIPATISKIENNAFSFWPYSILSKIQVSKDNKFYDCRENCNAIIETSTNTLIAGCDNTHIPESVERISACAFSAVKLKSLYIGPNIVSIDSVFADFFGLEEIKVSQFNKYYDSREDCNAIIETATNTLLKGCKNTMIPNSVKSLGVSSFATTNELETIDIPDSIDVIDEYAFCNCASLKKINIPQSTKRIGLFAFYNTNLTSVTLKNRNAKVHKDAFEPKVSINGQPHDYWLKPKCRYLDLQKQ